MRPYRLLLAAVVLCLSLTLHAQKPASLIHPGDVWLDNRGVPIQAHGGGVIRVGKLFYWFGEDRTPTNDPNTRYVACYASRDLAHWQYRGQVFQLKPTAELGDWIILERPKVFYNAKTKTYVMYVHLDGPGPGGHGHGYDMARVAVATSKRVTGPYTYVRSFRPLNQESRDIGQFVDDDGSAYLIFESRPTGGFYIAQLSDDYLDVKTSTSFVHAPLEGGALVHLNGLYYVLGSHMSGWKPNPNVYATAPTLAGPWTAFENIAPPATNTYDSQSAFLLKVTGSKTTSVIYIGDRWEPKTLPDSRYIWMPLEIGDGHMSLPELRPWSIDTHTGETKIANQP
ncbi:family 43 glycosylhydrolase [Silvibacterium sp.]|uniref:family 43 glycosylhydrolase n=1 Tax=Silvibacterium sp. TaxID=1964179 RepID=UPI0039E4807E